MTTLGDFQANVGIFTSGLHLIFAIIVSSILIIYGLYTIINNYKCQTPDECKTKQDIRKQKLKQGILSIVFGIIVFVAFYMFFKFVRKNKTLAQVTGSLAELDVLKKVL
jgi:hypothetical protein